ncbi:unnamed protein product [Mytilus coruscus]|uniref:Uncharacterized protein n=1 Tax=Mytilus coruscus TaxID=42192 RepID=A0A6J8AG52_MYTCO|nr:unnamed protein product [Mytilus coruscus]
MTNSGIKVKGSKKTGDDKTIYAEGTSKLSLTNLERAIDKAISKQNTESKTSRTVLNEELLNDILQDPTTPAVYKRRILQALNEKYLGSKQLRNHRENLHVDRTNNTKRQDKARPARRIIDSNQSSTNSYHHLRETSAVSEHMPMSPGLKMTYNVKSSPMTSDNSWIRTQSRRQISRGQSISRNKVKQPLPRIVCQSNKTPRELRVPPTFRRPSTFGNIHSKMSKSTQTNLLILERRQTFTRPPTNSSTQLNSSFSEFPVSKFSTGNQYYHRPNSIDFASNGINNNHWNVYDRVEDNEITYNQKQITIDNMFSSQRREYDLMSEGTRQVWTTRMSDSWLKSDRYEDERNIFKRTRKVGFYSDLVLHLVSSFKGGQLKILF